MVRDREDDRRRQGHALIEPAPAPRWRTAAQTGAQTAVAAWLSYVSAGAVGLHEGYWAAISSVVVLQSDLHGTRTSAQDRFVGTGIGAVTGFLCALLWHGHALLYALAVGLTVLLCALANLGNAGRLAAVTVSVIVLIARDEPIWKVALSRFLEVSWGIAIALIVAAAGGALVRFAGRR